MCDIHAPGSDSRNLIPWKNLATTQWRNGGGVTRQILSMRRDVSGEWVSAADGGADEWDWRLSIADVDAQGAFSRFPGMTRILTVIEGVSVTLAVDGVIEKLEKHRPFEFDGGAETSAALPNGPIRDLNLIARTGTVAARVNIEPLTAGIPRCVSDGQYCVILNGHVTLTLTATGSTVAGTAATSATSTPATRLDRFDTVLGDSQHPPTLTGEGTLALITVSASGAPASA